LPQKYDSRNQSLSILVSINNKRGLIYWVSNLNLSIELITPNSPKKQAMSIMLIVILTLNLLLLPDFHYGRLGRAKVQVEVYRVNNFEQAPLKLLKVTFIPDN